MKFDQDLCLILKYDPIGYFGKMNSTRGSVVPLAMFVFVFVFGSAKHFYGKVDSKRVPVEIGFLGLRSC